MIKYAIVIMNDEELVNDITKEIKFGMSNKPDCDEDETIARLLKLEFNDFYKKLIEDYQGQGITLGKYTNKYYGKGVYFTSKAAHNKVVIWLQSVMVMNKIVRSLEEG